MDPVNRTSIAGTRVSLQVVNPHTSGGPCGDSRIAVVHPDFAAFIAGRCQMYGDNECFFAWNGRSLIGETVLEANRVIAICGFEGGQMTRLGALPKRKYFAI